MFLLQTLRWATFLLVFILYVSFGNVTMKYVCLYDDENVYQFGIDTLCEISKDTTVAFIIDNFFWVAVSHSMIIAFTVMYYALASHLRWTPEYGEEYFDNKYDARAAYLNALRKYVVIRIKTFSLPVAIIFPISNELHYGGTDGSFGISDIFNGALFFLLLTPVFYVFMWFSVQFINNFFQFVAHNGSRTNVLCSCREPHGDKHRKNQQTAMAWFFSKLFCITAFSCLLYVGDSRDSKYNWIDLRLGGLGPYMMVFIAYCRIFHTFFSKISKIAKAEERQKEHGAVLFYCCSKQNTKNVTAITKKVKKKAKKTSSDSSSYSSEAKHILYLFLCKIPFSYNWAMLTILYSVAAVNVIFHLLVSASIKEDWTVTTLKGLLLLLTGWNMFAPLSILVQLSIDSWSDLDYLSIQFMESHVRVSTFIYDGEIVRDLPKEMVRLQGYEIFDDLDIDGGGTLSETEVKVWEELWKEKQKQYPASDSDADEFKELFNEIKKRPLTRKRFAIEWEKTVSYARALLEVVFFFSFDF